MDEMTLRLEEMADEDLIHVDLKQLAHLILYADYQVQKPGEKTKAYWLEAYRSDSTVQNYLRLFAEEDCALTQGIEVKKLLTSRAKASNYICRNEELRENIMDNRTWLYLNFFAGEFTKVKVACKNPENLLGWTGTFMEAGLTLFCCIFVKIKNWVKV